MATDHSTPQRSSNLSKTDFPVPDDVIEDFLGLGLAYSEWPAQVQKRNHVWYPGLEKTIIEKEWKFFKSEIQRLRLEPKIVQSSRSKSNSLASILKRLKGESWVEGRPDEREERLRTHRLLGKDAKIRCLQKYVHDWDQEAAFSTSPPSTQNSSTKVPAESAPAQRTVPNNTGLEIGFCCGSPEMRHSNDTPEPESRLNINANASYLINNCPPQLSSSMAPLPTQSDLSSEAAGDLNLSPAFQNVLSPPVETSGCYVESELSETLDSQPAFSHDITMALFDHSPIYEEAVPNSAEYSREFDLPEPEPNVLTWMETNQVSENFDSAETETPGPDPAFQGTFFNPRNSFDVHEYLVFEETGALEARSTTESMPADLARQHNSRQGCQEIVLQPILPPRSSSKGRKRRRQNTSTPSLDMPDCGNATTPATSHVASDGDTIMSGYESGSQYTNELVSQGSKTRLSRSSRPSPTPPWSGKTPEPAYTHIRTQIELELELRHAREELISTQKQHKKEMESFVRKLQEAEAEISELREQVQEVQASTEYYEGLARGLISDNIILQENSRNNSVSSLPSTSTKEREHRIKHAQGLTPSKNPRPLSLTLRPSIASKDYSLPRKLSASTFQDTPTIRLPIATSFSSVSDSRDSSQIFSENPVIAYNAHKPTSRKCRPDLVDRSQVSSGQPIAVPIPSNPTEGNNRSGSADSITTPNLSASTRRDPKTLQQFMHKFSNPFLRKNYREDGTMAVRTVPSLPILEASIPLNRPMASILVDSDKRLTNDSGYGSLRFETGSTVSMADAE